VDLRSGAYYGSYGHYYYSYYGKERRSSKHTPRQAVRRIREFVGRGGHSNGEGHDSE
jgi:hypothetical protein